LDNALVPAERDLVRANEADRDLADQIRERIRGRTLLLKVLRRRQRRRGLVNVSYDTLNPYWVRKADIE